MNKKLISFTISKALFELAYNVGNVFGTIFFYLIFNNSIIAAIGTFATASIIYAFLIAVLAKFLGKIGVRNSLIIGTQLFFISFLILSFIDKVNPFPYLISWLLVFSLARAFYHVPYHYYVMNFTKPKTQGASIGKLNAVIILVSMLMPFMGGTISNAWGVQGLALFSGGVFILSSISLLWIPNLKFNFTGNTFKLLDLQSTRRELRLVFTNEAQNKDRFWQLYVFLVVQGNFINFGILSTLVNVVSITFSWFFGKFMDHNNRLKILKIDSLLTAAIWFTRPLMTTPLGVTISSSILNIIADSRNQVVDLIDYDLIRRTGNESLLDERLVTREVYWNLLSAVLIFTMITIQLTLGWPAVFFFSGVAALLMLAF